MEQRYAPKPTRPETTTYLYWEVPPVHEGDHARAVVKEIPEDPSLQYGGNQPTFVAQLRRNLLKLGKIFDPDAPNSFETDYDGGESTVPPGRDRCHRRRVGRSREQGCHHRGCLGQRQRRSRLGVAALYPAHGLPIAGPAPLRWGSQTMVIRRGV